MPCACGNRDLCKCCQGACCSSEGIECFQATCEECDALGYKFQGVGTRCRETPATVTLEGIDFDAYCPCIEPADHTQCEKCAGSTVASKCSEGELCCDCTCQECCENSDCDEGECCVDGSCQTPTPPDIQLTVATVDSPVSGYDPAESTLDGSASFQVLPIVDSNWGTLCQYCGDWGASGAYVAFWIIADEDPIEIQHYGETPLHPVPGIDPPAAGTWRYVWRVITGTTGLGTDSDPPEPTATPMLCVDSSGDPKASAFLCYLDVTICDPTGGVPIAVEDSSYDFSSWSTNSEPDIYCDGDPPPCSCDEDLLLPAPSVFSLDASVAP
jgi:hypothetical protein